MFRVYGLADVLDLASVVDLLAEVPAYRALEDLHHEGEHRPCQRSIPAALGGLVAYERVLGLYLQELRTCRA